MLRGSNDNVRVGPPNEDAERAAAIARGVVGSQAVAPKTEKDSAIEHVDQLLLPLGPLSDDAPKR